MITLAAAPPIQIDPEFRALIPALMPDELAQLEANIRQDGCRDPLVTWNGVLLDGHNRLDICTRAGIPYQVVEAPLVSDRVSAKIWIIRIQFGRRNLTSFVRSELALKLKPLIAKQAKSRQGKRTDLLQKSERGIPIHTHAELARSAGVSHDTIAKVEQITRDASPAIVEAVRAGTLSVNLARAVAELPAEEQAEIAAAGADTMSAVARGIVKRVHVANNSGNNEWYTPANLVEAARSVLGDIDLDPASCETANRVVKAQRFFSIDDDGLNQPWSGRVFLNPPYAGALVTAFIDKLAASVERNSVESAIVLVNNATETGWFQRLASLSQAMCFPAARVRFWTTGQEDSKLTGLQGQAIVYIGEEVPTFVRDFTPFGFVVMVYPRACAK